MNTIFSFNTQNLNFYGKRISNTQRANIDNLLNSLLEKDLDMGELMKQSDLTNHAISDWFLKTKGITAVKYFKQKKQEKLRQELSEYYAQKIPDSEVAKIKNRSEKWVAMQYIKLGIKDSRETKHNKLNKTVNQLIQEGHSIKSIAEHNNCSFHTVHKWIEQNVSDSIVQYRHKNNIKLTHLDNPEYEELKTSIAELFAEGKTVAEVAKIKHLTKGRVYAIKRLYNLKTLKDITFERMEKMIPLFTKLKMKLPEMVKEIGNISEATVARYIKKISGKNYLDIRMGR